MGTPQIVLAGGGYVGLYAALELERRLGYAEADLTLVSPDSFMLYQPLLPEMAAGTLEPRQVVVPLRQTLKRTRVLNGSVVDRDSEGRRITVRPVEGPETELDYDHLVLGLGAVSRVLPIPGIREHAVGFKDIGEALYLRNHILSRLEVADATPDRGLRERALTFVFIGGGYTGVEALAELQDLAVYMCRHLERVRPQDLRFLLVDVADRILPTVDEDLAEHATSMLRDRGIDVRVETSVEEASAEGVTLSDGEKIPTDTIVWMTGVAPNPVLKDFGVPLDDQGRVVVDSYLRVEGSDGIWAGGDCAAVPDPDGGTYPPTAQHAQREGRHLGRNLTAALRGDPVTPFQHRSLGEMITLGRGKGVAQVMDRKVTGYPAWVMRRAYYATTIPTSERKFRLLADWTIGMIFPREVVHYRRVRPHESLLE